MTHPTRTTGIILIIIAMLLAAGCERVPEDRLGGGGIGDGEDQSEVMAAVDYADTMERGIETLEDPTAMPFDQAISRGNVQELTAVVERWDAAISIFEDASPPAEVSQQHNGLLSAMRRLNDWNERIRDAAQQGGGGQAKRVAKQARNSNAADDFDLYVAELIKEGYLPVPGSDGFDMDEQELDAQAPGVGEDF